MKLINYYVNEEIRLGILTDEGIIDAAKNGIKVSMDDIISADDTLKKEYLQKLKDIKNSRQAEIIKNYTPANVINNPDKLLCVGLNYIAHTIGVADSLGVQADIPKYPVLFSKFTDSLIPDKADVKLSSWETSYDYEAELVIVIGKECWAVDEESAMDYVFGYTCGNDFTCREAQKRSGQWLIGKAMPGFGPCGPCIVTADEFNPYDGKAIKSYVNGELRQNGITTDMIFDCRKVISYASHYIKLNPGDLIFTGTPSGVVLENKGEKKWLKHGDVIRVEIEGIGTLTNTMD